jgi:uncharacterized membrane protein
MLSLWQMPDPHWGVAWSGWLLALMFTLAALATGGARALIAPTRQAAAAGVIVMLAAIWTLEIRVPGVPALGLGGAALAVVLFGLRGALVALAAASVVRLTLGAALGLAGFGFGNVWEIDVAAVNLGIQHAAGCITPALAARMLVHLIRTWLPRNPFVFILGHGFFTGWLAAVVAVASGVAVLRSLDLVTPSLASSTLAYGGLLSSADAFITGALTAIFVVYRPDWVLSFDDRQYLQPRIDA